MSGPRPAASRSDASSSLGTASSVPSADQASGRCLQRQRRHGPCHCRLHRGDTARSQDCDAYNNRGLAYSDKGENDRAIADYTEAIRLDPKYANAYINRGLAYREKGETDRAIADFTEAIRLDPKFADAYVNRGLAYEKLADFARARSDFNTTLGLSQKGTTGRRTRRESGLPPCLAPPATASSEKSNVATAIVTAHCTSAEK